MDFILESFTSILGNFGNVTWQHMVMWLIGGILIYLAIAKDKPILRGMGLYHGKQGTGVSVEAKVRTGPITNLNCTQTVDGKLKFIITEAASTDGTIMTIGNTQTPVKFNKSPDEYFDEWFRELPTHHFAMSVGHNASQLVKVAKVLNIPFVELNK